MRYLLVVLDLSRAALLTDWRPTRAVLITRTLRRFLPLFFEQNPLSKLGIMVLRNGVAEQLTELSSSPHELVSKLSGGLEGGGDASLQNALDAAVDMLKAMPAHGRCEVLLLLSALCTCDPGDIMASIRAAKQQGLQVSVVGVAAEMQVCRTAVQQTGGSYGVALNEAHMEQLVLEHALPGAVLPGSAGVSLMMTGFPTRNTQAAGAAAFMGSECVLQAGGFSCPQCKARVLELPSQCHICGLLLLSSPQLARSYHSRFQAPAIRLAEGLQTCHGCCATPVEAGTCPECGKPFCSTCQDLIRSALHSCPGCCGA